MKIGVVVDSTVDIPPEIIAKLKIKVIPLKIIWGEEEYLDRVDLSAEEFFKRLLVTKILPRSSAPTAGEFVAVYKEMLAQGYDLIISYHLSAKLSGTIQAANIAVSMVDSKKIRIYDSFSTSVGAGVKLLQLIECINFGGGLEEIEDIIHEREKKHDLIFVVDSLDYLYRGGRIGAAQKLLGNLFDMKPLLGIEDGAVVPVGRIRGRKNIIKKIEGFFVAWKEAKRKIEFIGIAYSNDRAIVDDLNNLAIKYYPEAVRIQSQVSPVIGCHAGPGLIGIGVF